MEIALDRPRVARASESAAPSGRPSDGDLIRRIAARDRDAFDELYGRYARPVLGLALRRLGDRDRAEEAVQETFAAIWRSARSYRPERGAGGPWVYAVARNAIVDRFRSRGEPVAEAPDAADEARGPAERAEVADVAWRVHRALEELPPAERTVLELAYWSGLSQSEVASYLGHPARDGEDADARGARAARVRARRGGPAVRGRELDELLEGDPRLRAVHDMLVEAGPPPELPPSLEHAPGSAPAPRVRLLPRRRLGAALVLAAAFALALFGAGYLVSARTGPDAGFEEDFALTMQGTPAARGASATLLVGELDEAGNWPMEMTVRGLPALPDGGALRAAADEGRRGGGLVRHLRGRGRDRRLPERAVPPAGLRRVDRDARERAAARCCGRRRSSRRYGAVRSFATNAAYVTGMCSSRNRSTASA